MPPQYIFQIEQLSKIANKKEILKNVWISFYPGAKIGVLGVNGSGKSTLLRIMAGVDKDFTGMAKPANGTRIGFGGPLAHQANRLDGWRVNRRNHFNHRVLACPAVGQVHGRPQLFHAHVPDRVCRRSCHPETLPEGDRPACRSLGHHLLRMW